jgi:hypothetical protein
MSVLRGGLIAAGMVFSNPLMAQSAAQPSEELDALHREVEDQNGRIGRLETLIEAQNALIEELRRELRSQNEPTALAATGDAAHGTPLATTDISLAPEDSESGLGIQGLDAFGDARVRQELNLSDRQGRSRGRTVVRARIGATYQAHPNLAFGARLVTGDPDDPNTADVTLGSFADDIPIAMDQLWLRYENGGLAAYAGKFPQILMRTDMVWDGDVMPQGFGFAYGTSIGDDLVVGANGLYFAIDESAGGPDSYMTGTQLTSNAVFGANMTLDLAAAYYRYSLTELGSANAGDFRGNIIADGRYVSDFRLVDLIGRLGFHGLGETWPAALTVNYVKNLGSRGSEDTGFLIGASLGRQSEGGDWRLAFDYSMVEADAVFAAFSHDNIAISTNYELHALTVENRLASNLAASLNWYHYRPLHDRLSGSFLPDDWLNRFRLNLTYEF